VKVQVNKGAVNLLGTVFSEDDRGIVHEIVAGIAGVTVIKNNLQTEELGDV
jgi:osmotically-inducible protein OsmY